MTRQDNSQVPEPVSERQMRLMLDAIPVRIWFLDRQHRVRFANQEAAAMFMLDPAEIVGRGANDLLGKAGFAQDVAIREKALLGSVARWEGWTRYPDGEDRYTERIFNPHFSRSGEIDGYYEFVRDVTELKRAEQSERRSAQLLKDAIDSIPQGFCVFDSSGLLQTCNRAFATLVGAAPRELVGRSAGEVLAEIERRIRSDEGSRQRDNGVGTLKSLRAEDGGPRGPLEIELDDGRWFRINRHATADHGSVMLFSEVTEAKRFEQELLDSEQRFRSIAGVHPVPVIITSSDGTIFYASPTWLNLFGYSDEDLATISACDCFADPNGYEHYVALMDRDGDIDESEFPFRKSDGSRFWAALTARRIAFEGRDALVAGIHDLTERRAAEGKILRQQAALAESERRLRTIVESHPVPLFVIDIDSGRFVYESPAAAQLLGHRWPARSEHFVADHFIDPDARRSFVEILRRGERLTDFELEASRSDGSVFWASLTAQWMELDGREASIVSVTDLTERKEREDELRQARELLKDAIDSMSEGFALFDADDRLVTCNAQYLSYNEPHDDLLVPGARWRDIIRTRAERGFFAEAIGQVDAWLEERDKERETPVRREVRVSGNRWFLISSRRTRQGGSVVLWQDITDRKRMEDALRESEELIRRVVEDCPLPIVMTRALDGQILYESPSTRSAFGIGSEEQFAFAPERFVNPPDRKHYVDAIYEKGAVDEYEIEFRKADGTSFVGAVSARLVKYHGEDVIVATTIDVTEARRREAQLRQARELLEDAIESLSEGFALYDADDRLIMCNQQYREQNPKTRELLAPGMPWIEFIREGARRGQYVGADDVERFVEQRRMDRLSLRSNVEFQQSDGRWFQFSNQRTRQGGIVVTRTDITERKTMEVALRESEGLIRRVLEAHPIPVGMSRLEDGLLIYESPGLKSLFGRQHEPARTVYATDFYADPEDRITYIEMLRRTLEVDDFKVLFKRVDGSEFWASISSRMFDFAGEEVAVFSTIDLTEKLAAEAEIERQRAALYQSEKMSALGSLLAGVAHELNNPLSVVLGQALMLQDASDHPQVAERAAKIGRAADRCARIVKTFLSMARDQKPMRKWIDLNEVVESALEVVGYSLRQDNVDIKLTLEPDLPSIWGDSDQINQVVTNIALNAQQALREVGEPRTLSIETAHLSRTDSIRLTIADNGPGIPSEIQDRIFDPFFTTKPVGTGTGIGLAFCQRILDAHGGTIRVQSGSGEGTAFIVEFLAGEGDFSTHSPAVDRISTVSDLHILVVDDEPEVAAILHEMLEALGHRPVAVTSGRAAMAFLLENDPDIIVSDLRMPGIDGPRLFDWLRVARPDFVDRIAFVTGDQLSASARAFLANAGRPHISKPVQPIDLDELIRSMRANVPDRGSTN